ncbi:hypothetical protein DIPPA_25258 [Diplonema papillatum]|nr:hypothetical protein DIPPA_25258 [Diplonema papillatum]
MEAAGAAGQFLPEDLHLRVLSYLTGSELMRCRRVSGAFDEAARDETLWEAVCKAKWSRGDVFEDEAVTRAIGDTTVSPFAAYAELYKQGCPRNGWARELVQNVAVQSLLVCGADAKCRFRAQWQAGDVEDAPEPKVSVGVEVTQDTEYVAGWAQAWGLTVEFFGRFSDGTTKHESFDEKSSGTFSRVYTIPSFAPADDEDKQLVSLGIRVEIMSHGPPSALNVGAGTFTDVYPSNALPTLCDVTEVPVDVFVIDTIQECVGFSLFDKPAAKLRMMADSSLGFLVSLAAQKLNVALGNVVTYPMSWHRGSYYTIMDTQPVSPSSFGRRIDDVFDTTKGCALCVSTTGAELLRVVGSGQLLTHVKRFDPETAQLQYVASMRHDASSPTAEWEALCVQTAEDKFGKFGGAKSFTKVSWVGKEPPFFVSTEKGSSMGDTSVSHGDLIVVHPRTLVPQVTGKQAKGLHAAWDDEQAVKITCVPTAKLVASVQTSDDATVRSLQLPRSETTYRLYTGHGLNNSVIRSKDLAESFIKQMGIRTLPVELSVSASFDEATAHPLPSDLGPFELVRRISGRLAREVVIFYDIDASSAEKEPTAADAARARADMLRKVEEAARAAASEKKAKLSSSSSQPAPHVSPRPLVSVPDEPPLPSAEERRRLLADRFNSAQHTLRNEEIRTRVEQEKDMDHERKAKRQKSEAERARQAKQEERATALANLAEAGRKTTEGGFLARQQMMQRAEEEKAERRQAASDRDRQAMLQEKRDAQLAAAAVKRTLAEQGDLRARRQAAAGSAPAACSSSPPPAAAPAKPSDGEKLIQFVLPTAERKEHTFQQTATLADVRGWLLAACPELSADATALISNFPRRPFSDDEMTMSLQQLSFARRTQIAVQVTARE